MYTLFTNIVKAVQRLSCLLLACVLSAPAWADFTSYHIGNSLTWDSQPNAVAAMARSRGHDHRVGYHIRCGSSLVQIAGDDQTCVPPVERFGTWRSALAGHRFDAITIQPHTRSTLAQDQAVILEMIDTAIAGGSTYGGTRFYIYQAWPRTGNAPDDYTQRWLADTPDDDDTPMAYTRQYFAHLLARVREARPEARVDLIPVGEVFARIDAQLKSGDLVIADYTSANDFYREAIHLHMNDLGRFVAATTVYAVLHDEDPRGLALPAGYFSNADDAEHGIVWDAAVLTPQTAAALQAVVWEVVSDRHR